MRALDEADRERLYELFRKRDGIRVWPWDRVRVWKIVGEQAQRLYMAQVRPDDVEQLAAGLERLGVGRYCLEARLGHTVLPLELQVRVVRTSVGGFLRALDAFHAMARARDLGDDFERAEVRRRLLELLELLDREEAAASCG